MVSKVQWMRAVGLTFVLLNGVAALNSPENDVQKFVWLNVFIFWALLHLWILSKIIAAWIQFESTSAGVFWVMLKLGSLAALAQFLVISRKSTTPIVILTGLTAFIVVPIVASLNASRT